MQDQGGTSPDVLWIKPPIVDQKGRVISASSSFSDIDFDCPSSSQLHTCHKNRAVAGLNTRKTRTEEPLSSVRELYTIFYTFPSPENHLQTKANGLPFILSWSDKGKGRHFYTNKRIGDWFTYLMISANI
ncbi:hypothetical protein NE237_006178 [Protea cynaroides]|uniref:Uncharacterized protein n=1 Tax=Protea cynaroides TaxID=273540 RepID=A0A9Q0QVA6_9MAGN|nr:hypothetical protein NE237_006178 [Protea cynaroides]